MNDKVRDSNVAGSRTRFLDGLRGAAAAYVVISHSRYLVWEGYHDGFVKHPNLYSTIGRSVARGLNLFAFGPDAVLFFFVLSGFVIHISEVRRSSRAGVKYGMHVLPYLSRRFWRLYPPLLFSLLLTFVIDSYGRHLQLPIFVHPSGYDTIDSTIHLNHQSLTLIGNLLFTMHAYVPVWGSNGALWSLMYEWWFYMLYIGLKYIHDRSKAFSSIAISILFITSRFLPRAGLLVLPHMIFGLLPLWWFGVILSDFYADDKRRLLRYCCIGLIIFPLAFRWRMDDLRHQYCIGIGMMGLMAALLLTRSNRTLIVSLARLSWLGDMSYTLYIIHLPILVLLAGLLMGHSATRTLPRSQILIPIVVVSLIILSFFISKVIERPFFKRRASPTVAVLEPMVSA